MGYDDTYDSGEDYVREMVATHLNAAGTPFTCVSRTSEKGRDIVVHSTPRRIIEIKGYPSARVSRGANRGKLKAEPKRRLQAQGWIWDAIRQLYEHHATTPDDELAIGLPARPFYRSYMIRFAVLRTKLSLFVYLVLSDGTVVPVPPTHAIPTTVA